MGELGQIKLTDTQRLDENSQERPKPVSNGSNLESASRNIGVLHPNQKSKSSAIILFIVFGLGIVCGIIWFMLAGCGDTNQSNQTITGTDMIENNDINDSDDELPDQTVTLSLNDALVQKVYRNFDRISFPDENSFSFYVDKNSMSGNPDRARMLYLAKNNVVTRFCNGEYFDPTSHIQMSVCYSGSEIVQKIAEIFGQDLILNESDTLGHGCGSWIYDTQNDEFHEIALPGCGGSDPRRVARKLYAAKKDSDHVYLYEIAIYIEAAAVYHIGDKELAGAFMGQQSDLGIETSVRGDVLQGDIEKYQSLLEQDAFKWTFVWNGENYIFEKLERV